jgi:hypothetical protein
MLVRSAVLHETVVVGSVYIVSGLSNVRGCALLGAGDRDIHDPMP